MIPKKIHYCWFSNDPLPKLIKNCIESWEKYLPDYEIVLWDSNSFDFNSIQFVKEAYEAKKWAFVTDYVRFYALYTQGGFYLDSDVQVLRTFPNNWLNYGFISAHEVHPVLMKPGQLNDDFLPSTPGGRVDGISIQGAIMGAEAGHPFLKDCLEQYSKMNFFKDNGEINDIDEIIIGQVLFRAALPYGYRCEDKNLELTNHKMLILASNILVGNAIHLDKDSYAIHLANGGWHDKKGWSKVLHEVRNNFPIIFPLFYFIDKIIRKLKIK